MTTPRSFTPPGRDGEAGQVLVLVAVVLLAMVALLALVADGGVLFAARRDLQGTADGAARAGAGALDQATYRATNGQVARLDPDLARTATARYLEATGFAGRTSVAADTAQVSVILTRDLRPPLLGVFGAGAIEVRARAVAQPQTGITTPEVPSS